MYENIEKKKGYWESFDDIDGLGHECGCLLEDREGNIWIGTDKGLSRYDGRTFLTFTDEDGLVDNSVQCIHQDKKGDLWIGTTNGLSRFDGRGFVSFTEEDGLISNYIYCIYQDKVGNIWIGARDGLSRYDNSGFISFTDKDGLASNGVYCIYQDKDDDLWFGTRNGVSRYNGRESFDPIHADNLPETYIWSIDQDRKGNIWIGTPNGLIRYDGERFTTFTQEDGLPGNDVRCICQDKEGNIWLGTLGDGVSRYDGNEFVNFNTESGLAHNAVFDVLQDREGSLWFACYHGGVSRYSPYHISPISNEAVDEVMMQDRGGDLWWGFRSTLSQFDGKDINHCPFEHNVFEIFEDSAGHFWIGTDGSGVFRYKSIKDFRSVYEAGDVKTHAAQNLTVDEGLANNRVTRIYEDAQGNIWIGTRGGLSRYDGAKFTNFTTDDGLGSNVISAIFQDSGGTLWFGGWGGGGITKYDGDTFHRYTKGDGLIDDRIVCIIEDDKNDLWIGTFAGISCYDGKSFRNYTTADGLFGVFIQRMIRDSREQIWIATLGGGVSRFDGRNFQSLTTDDGLPSNCVTGIIEEPDGNIIISTYRGVCRYMPDYETPPLIRIDEIDADRIYSNPEDIQLSEDISSIRIRYHGVSFKTKRVRYSYILEGYDKDWGATWDEEVRYEDLPIGEYTFKVIAISKDLVYSESPAELRLSVVDDPRDMVISELEEEVRNRTAELREAKDYIDNVVRSMLNSLIVINPDGIIMTVNQATLDLLNYEEDELIGRPFEMILAEEEPLQEVDLDSLVEDDSVLNIEKEFIRNIENTYLSKDGTRIPVIFSGSIMRDDDGEIQGTVCVAENITIRKQAEEKNRQQNEFLRSILESLTHPFYVIDAQNYIVKMANSAARLEGLVEDQTCFDADGGSKPCQVVDEIHCPVREITKSKEPTKFEHVHLDEDGSIRNIEIHGYPIFDSEGNVSQIIEYCLDVTERRQAEEELRKHRDHLEELVEERTRKLRESEEMYRTIFETTGTAAVMVEEDTTVSLVNTEFEKLSGYSREETEGKRSWTEFATKDALERLSEYHRLRRMDPGAAPGSYEAQFIKSNGQIRDCLITVSMIAGTKKSVVFVVDITEHKEEAERIQTAKMEALRQLVAGVAHQMNSPIGAITGNSDVSNRAVNRIRRIMTEEYPQELEEHEHLVRALTVLEKANQVSKTAADAIANIVANLRHFVRLDEAEWQFADIHEGMDSVIALMESELSNRIEVTRDYGDIPRIYCSPSNLNQVFMSLLKNASEAIAGKGEIRLRTADKGDCVTVEIDDTGKGIPADDINRIFDPGFTTKGVRVGVGLGLSICHKIVVDEHQGHIDVSSEPGKGTTFTVTLPKHRDHRRGSSG